MNVHVAPSRRAGRAPAAVRLAVVALVAVAAAACTGGPGATPSPSVVAASPSLALPPSAPPASDGEGSGVPQTIVDAAIADAAGRAGVDPGGVTVVSTESRTWPNGALGCPETGMMYTEVLTPGYRVVVEAGGAEYDYRASARSDAVQWCENPPPSS